MTGLPRGRRCRHAALRTEKHYLPRPLSGVAGRKSRHGKRYLEVCMEDFKWQFLLAVTGYNCRVLFLGSTDVGLCVVEPVGLWFGLCRVMAVTTAPAHTTKSVTTGIIPSDGVRR